MGPLAALGIGAGAKLLGGLFGAKSKKKQEQAQRKAAIGQAELRNQMGEDTRTARAALAQSLLGQAGSDFALDPALAARLAERRTYDFSKGVPEAGAGGGSALLSGLFGGIGDVASLYGINQDSGGGESSDVFYTGQGSVPTQAVSEGPITLSSGKTITPFDTGLVPDFSRRDGDF